MLHTVLIDDDSYFDLVNAADDFKMTINEFEAWAIADAVSSWRRRKRGKAALIAALEDVYIIPSPGGD